MDIECPGCGTELTLENAGGYQTFCEKCVDAMPKIPQEIDYRGFVKGFYIEGKYPDFRWASGEDK